MNIGVFFGGKNTEHDVSIITGQLIISGLKELGYNPVPIYIAKNGSWFSDPKMDSIDFFKNIDPKQDLNEAKSLKLSLTEATSNGVEFKTKGIFSKTINIDIAFPALHGKNGEDGTIQGLFELLNIPYIGCDVTASAITMDKGLTKLIYQRFNMPTANFIHFQKEDYLANTKKILYEINKNLPWPMIVKPANLGSSIGISKASNDQELINAIEVALHYDYKVIVEESIEDLMDLTVCVIGNAEPRASLIQESAFSKDLFTYEDKYINDGGAQLGNALKKLIIPATLDKKTTEEIQNMAVEAYKVIGCSGIARVDFLYSKTFKKYYINEINPMPGTIYHHLWKKSGIELVDLLRMLIIFAQEKHDRKNKITYTFDSSILQQSNSNKMKLKGIE